MTLQRRMTNAAGGNRDKRKRGKEADPDLYLLAESEMTPCMIKSDVMIISVVSAAGGTPPQASVRPQISFPD